MIILALVLNPDSSLLWIKDIQVVGCTAGHGNSLDRTPAQCIRCILKNHRCLTKVSITEDHGVILINSQNCCLILLGSWQGNNINQGTNCDMTINRTAAEFIHNLIPIWI